MLERLPSYRPGGRVAVWIVVAVAIASIVTGVVAILTEPALETAGPLGALQTAAEFSGTVVGFALLVTAWGMHRGYRIAYITAAAFVFLAAAHGVIQYRLFSVPLVVLSIGGLVVLVLTSERFTRSSALDSTQLGALVAIVGVFCYGTAGAYTLRAQFDELDTVIDAVYFTLVTASTVGYGDIHPLTETARLFAISLVVLGPITVGVAVGSLFGPALENRLARTGRRATSHHSRSDGVEGGRIAVLGSDQWTAGLAEALSGQIPVTVVTTEEGTAQRLPDAVEIVVGDPTDTRVLGRAEVDACDAVLVTTAEELDATDASLAARAVTDARIVMIADRDANEPVEDGEADAVVDPEAVVVDAVVRAALGSDESADQSPSSAASQRG
ncbi:MULTISPECIES: ion channel [Natrialbaceae]|uniref:ion channel n=1 Tax=Natrialbaceae TaxID=1644061 RepID=UPI00207C6506|nr:ion channel [Natronococcus sp. CG52]